MGGAVPRAVAHPWSPGVQQPCLVPRASRGHGPQPGLGVFRFEFRVLYLAKAAGLTGRARVREVALAHGRRARRGRALAGDAGRGVQGAGRGAQSALSAALGGPPRVALASSRPGRSASGRCRGSPALPTTRCGTREATRASRGRELFRRPATRSAGPESWRQRARHHCHFRGGAGRGRAPVPFKALSISVSCGRNFRKRDTNRRAQGHLDRTLGRRYRETSKRPATTPGAAKRSAKCLLPGKDVNSEGDYFFPSRQRLWRNLSVGKSEDSSGLNFQSSVKKGWEGKMTPKQRAGRRDLLLFMDYSAS